ncbi:MAG TPA: hypothetical protein VFV23_03245 [Verrucomicrobiae bacterium]|nr:hypothetical protein [Verrucomicrobiae bacterium]
MRLSRLPQNSLLTLLLIFAAQTTRAQLLAPDDFFDSGAQFYISNNIPAALERTESGLKLYPQDEKLQKLEKLLKQQQQSQQNQQNQKNQQQKNQSQQNNSQKQQPQKQDGQKNQSPQKQQQKNNQSPNPEQKKQPEEEKNGAQKAVEGKMTPEQAKHLLDSQKDDEQVLKMKPEGKPQDEKRPVKDW